MPKIKNRRSYLITEAHKRFCRIRESSFLASQNQKVKHVYLNYGIFLISSFTAQSYSPTNKFQTTTDYSIYQQPIMPQNKNIMEHNTMTMKELIHGNNQTIMNNMYKDLLKE